MPLNTAVCWVHLCGVINGAPSWRAKTTPAWYSVAGSCVVDTTTTWPGAAGAAGAGAQGRGTGQNEQMSRSALRVNAPYDANGATCRVR